MDINFFKEFFYLFLERGAGGEKEGEKHQRVVASHASPTGDLAEQETSASSPMNISNYTAVHQQRQLRESSGEHIGNASHSGTKHLRITMQEVEEDPCFILSLKPTFLNAKQKLPS